MRHDITSERCSVDVHETVRYGIHSFFRRNVETPHAVRCQLVGMKPAAHRRHHRKLQQKKTAAAAVLITRQIGPWRESLMPQQATTAAVLFAGSGSDPGRAAQTRIVHYCCSGVSRYSRSINVDQ
ncbi:unnamed protein product [Pylaiella littoralis]